MSDSFKFQVDCLPDEIFKPLLSLSIITKDHDYFDEIGEVEQNYFTFQCGDVLNLLQEIGDSAASFFVLEATQGNNTIEFTSEDRVHFKLQLSEYSYSHHHYVGRYLKFIKKIAAKGSTEYGTTFSASVKMSKEKYTKDVEALVASLFSDAEVTLLSDVPLEKVVHGRGRNWKRANSQIKKCEILSATNLTPLTVDEVTPDDLEDFYEYLSILHFNAYPSLENSFVAATTSYMYSIEEGTRVAPEKLFLISLSNISPDLLHEILHKEHCLSVQATTENSSFLSYYSGEHLYTWEVSRS